MYNAHLSATLAAHYKTVLQTQNSSGEKEIETEKSLQPHAHSSVLDESAQRIEIVGEGLAGAAGVPDGHRHVGAGSKGEGHGHPVVVVGVYGRHVQLLRRCDDAVVRSFLDRRSQLAKCKQQSAGEQLQMEHKKESTEGPTVTMLKKFA
jgi:hypothetical protein